MILDNIWLYWMILDHTRLYLIILDHIDILENSGPLWTIQPFWTIMDYFGSFWTILDDIGRYWTLFGRFLLLDHFGKFDCFGTFWTTWPFWSILTIFDHETIWDSFEPKQVFFVQMFLLLCKIVFLIETYFVVLFLF